MHADRHTSRRVYTMFWTLTDDYLLELAIRSDADFLITGDADLLVIKRIKQCHIVTIKEFELYWIGSQDNVILHEP